MVNFKCCPNIFVIFLGKKMEIYIYIYIYIVVFNIFFFWKKKIAFCHVADATIHSRPRGSQSMQLIVATWTIIHVANVPRGVRPTG
jgi:AAA+ ATPase superfamily predicted ATPase